MNRKLKALLRMLTKESIEQANEELRLEFRCLGKGGRNFSEAQKKFACLQIEISGIRATSRILEIPRRTLQRWARSSGVYVKECPDWVVGWAERRRKRREFWERRGYS